ncbi:acetoacetate decarboxylase family protein [Streptomyces sp. ISL-43]|uniref:acetoacetate decarboxylase family protein n=1 Tax=Streptomyces sp. ISL-43 TaxID=2819183 RepID=UPI001BEC29A6|nr:acetoacetate decarboxylase family protein [Streptomyces sp. ISL-43]
MTSPDPRHPAEQSTPFPPEPWHLNGDMYASLWRIRPRDLPCWPLPPETRPLIVLGHCTLLTFWVDYRAPGTLAYRELLIALAVRHRRRTAATAVAAWVDNEQSLAGGHHLWGIPKQLGHFTFTTPNDANTSARNHRHAPGHRNNPLGAGLLPSGRTNPHPPHHHRPPRPTTPRRDLRGTPGTRRLTLPRQGPSHVRPRQTTGIPQRPQTRAISDNPQIRLHRRNRAHPYLTGTPRPPLPPSPPPAAPTKGAGRGR